MAKWTWQAPAWHSWAWDSGSINASLKNAEIACNRLEGVSHYLGKQISFEAHLNALIDDALGTAGIEGVALAADSVRSSIVNQLGLPQRGLSNTDAKTEGQVTLLLDANYDVQAALSSERLFEWHRCLFPFEASFKRFPVGAYRSDSVVVASGMPPKQTIHFEGPPAASIPSEMKYFITWFEDTGPTLPPLIFSALAHFWFVTLHPFGDGNGRIARALGDLALSKKHHNARRLYSISASIMAARQSYYDILQSTQQGKSDISAWIEWYLSRIEYAVEKAEEKIRHVVVRLRFWEYAAHFNLNERQKKALRKMLDGDPKYFEGGMTTRKYSSINQCAKPAAAKDLIQLREMGVLSESEQAGRSTHYQIRWDSLGD